MFLTLCNTVARDFGRYLRILSISLSLSFSLFLVKTRRHVHTSIKEVLFMYTTAVDNNIIFGDSLQAGPLSTSSSIGDVLMLFEWARWARVFSLGLFYFFPPLFHPPVPLPPRVGTQYNII